MLQKQRSGNGRPATLPPSSEKETRHPFHQGCPYFALMDDPDTSLLFPSSMGHCHRAQPSAPVHLNHQETHCLTARHKGCPVYLQAGPLPTSLRGQEITQKKPRRRYMFVLSILAIAILAALFGIWRNGLINLPAGLADPTEPAVMAIVQSTATQVPVVETAVPTVTLPATETAVPMPPSPPPQPTHTATPPPTVTPIPTIALPATFTPVPPQPQAIISVAPVNLRTGPDTSYPILRTINEVGARFDIVGRLDTGGWWQICCVNNETGWITEEGIDFAGDSAIVPTLSAPNPQAVVLADRLNIRSGPSTDYPIVALVEAGAIYDVIGRLNDGTWWQICCLDDNPAWLISEGVEIQGIQDLVPIVEAPPPPAPEE
ncbi:MAG: SH3 domain-containing protein [Ardenticatenaceae bacterium]|nr:SH3 domain-containing protein [Ardenticatenaceae bacterium]MCB9004711.1 SH3 domain-containing protein [Ardenticatenaceae bacterium]